MSPLVDRGQQRVAGRPVVQRERSPADVRDALVSDSALRRWSETARVAILITITSWVCSQRAIAQGPQSTGSSTACNGSGLAGRPDGGDPVGDGDVAGDQAREMAVRDPRQLGRARAGTGRVARTSRRSNRGLGSIRRAASTRSRISGVTGGRPVGVRPSASRIRGSASGGGWPAAGVVVVDGR